MHKQAFERNALCLVLRKLGNIENKLTSEFNTFQISKNSSRKIMQVNLWSMWPRSLLRSGSRGGDGRNRCGLICSTLLAIPHHAGELAEDARVVAICAGGRVGRG